MKPERGSCIQQNSSLDHKLFNELYEKYNSLIYNFAYYLTQNRGEAEDLFQETWMRIIKNFPKDFNDKRCRAWLLTITTNLYRDGLRKKRTRRLFLLQKFREFKQYQRISSFEPSGMRQNKNDQMENINTSLAIAQALAKLPERQRLVFILKEVEGFQQAEISQILKMPLGTVKSLMYRAVRRLRCILSLSKTKTSPNPLIGEQNEM